MLHSHGDCGGFDQACRVKYRVFCKDSGLLVSMLRWRASIGVVLMQLIGVLLCQNTLLTCFDWHVQHAEVIFRSLKGFNSNLLLLRRLLERQQIRIVPLTISTNFWFGAWLNHLLVRERIVTAKRVQTLLDLSSYRVQCHHRRVIGIFFDVFVIKNFCFDPRRQFNLVITADFCPGLCRINFLSALMRIVLRRRLVFDSNCSLLLNHLVVKLELRVELIRVFFAVFAAVLLCWNHWPLSLLFLFNKRAIERIGGLLLYYIVQKLLSLVRREAWGVVNYQGTISLTLLRKTWAVCQQAQMLVRF